MAYPWMVSSIVLFNIFSDGAGGCFGKSKSDAEWLYRSIDAEAEAVQHSKCTIQQQVALKRE